MKDSLLFKIFMDFYHRALSFLKTLLASPVGRQRLFCEFLKRFLFLYLLFWGYAFIAYPQFVPRSLIRLPEISIIIPFLFILVLLLPFFPQYLPSLSGYPLVYYIICFGLLFYWVWDFIHSYQWDSRSFLSPSELSEEGIVKERISLESLQDIPPEIKFRQRISLSPSEKKQRLLCGFLKKLLFTYLLFWVCILICTPPSIPGSIEELFWLLISVFLYLLWVLICWPFDPKSFIFADGPMLCTLFYIIFLCFVFYWIWDFIRNEKFRIYLS